MCCRLVWGPRRSGRGGLHRGATPAPGYSAEWPEEKTQVLTVLKQRVCWGEDADAKPMARPLTVQGLTVRALLMNWNCSIPDCRKD